MAGVRFKLCSHCGDKREWALEDCPSCEESDFKRVEDNKADLVENAIGDTVSNPILFENEVPLVELSDEGKFARILPDMVRSRVSSMTVSVLNNLIADYLQPGEQPHFILRSLEPVRVEQEDEITEFHPSDDFHNPTRIVITDQRVLFLIGQEKKDVLKSHNYAEITSVVSESSLLSTKFILQASGASYCVSGCEPHQEISPAVAYIRAQTEPPDKGRATWSDEDYEVWKGSSVSDKVGEAFEQVDVSEVLSCGAVGAKFGSRAGPKGSAVGFVVGTAVGIWKGVSDQDPETANAPDPERVAQKVKTWQQSGAKTDDEKIEWMAASAGAASAIATENADHHVAELLESIDPEDAVRILELGSKAIASTEQEVSMVNTAGESLPDITNLRQPTSEFASILANLLDQGLFEELVSGSNRVE